MNPLLFIESAEPGGAEEVVCQLAEGLKGRGIEALILTLQDGWLTETLTKRTLPFRRLRSERRLDALLPLRIARIIKERRCDLLHSHLLDSTFYGAIAARIAGVAHLGTDHGDVHLPQGKKFHRFKIRTAARLGTQFTAVSRFTAARLRELGVPERQVTVLGNPILPKVAVTAEDRARIRKELGISGDDHWVWLHAGMLRPVKDQQTLIRGFALAAGASPGRQTLLIAGEGPERPALEALIEELGCSETIRLLGFRDDLRAILPGADGFVLTSWSEALPMSLLEAGSNGLLLVATRVGGIPEIIEDGTTGWLVDPGDHRELARIMAGAVDRPGESATLARAAQESIAARFAGERVLNEYIRLCESLIGR